ncbi:MAG: RHS repeat-associated core domain-containing protein [Nanoarchaeota archaeon]
MGKRNIFFILMFIFLFFFHIYFISGETNYNLVYDSNGNLISGFDFNYYYDGFNRLVNTTNNAGNLISEYFYDYEGNRIMKIDYNNDGSNTTTYYINENFIQIVNSSGIYNETYYYADGELIAKENNGDNKTYYHPDLLGSTTLVTNQSGNVIEEEFYLPFGGNLEGDEESRFLYTGEEKDRETGIYYYGARYYDSYLRHFIQPDSVLADIYDPQQLNRYSYARNNPYKYTDSSGNVIDTVIDVGFIGYDLYTIIQNPKESSNYIALAADVGGALLPFATGLGAVIRTTKGVEKAGDLAEGFKFLDKGGEIVSGTKNIPNPFGAKGSLEHQAKIKEIISNIESKGLQFRREVTITDPITGVTRRADIISIDPITKQITEVHQIGRTTQTGIPILRERMALLDIRNAISRGAVGKMGRITFSFSKNVETFFNRYVRGAFN